MTQITGELIVFILILILLWLIFGIAIWIPILVIATLLGLVYVFFNHIV
jgi:hypothetical protein